MIVRASLLGFLAWLLATVAFRTLGDSFFYPGSEIPLFVGGPLGAGALTWAAMKLLGVRPGDQAEAAIALAMPGMFLDAYATHEFATVYPNLDPTLDGVFGALMLVVHGAIVFAGLMFTRLQPEDERL